MTGPAAVCGLLGLALLAYPVQHPAAARARALRPGARPAAAPAASRLARLTAPRSAPLHAAIAGGVAGFLSCGVVVACCAALLCAMATRMVVATLSRRAAAREVAALVESVEALVGELRAGAAPGAALRDAAQTLSDAAVRSGESADPGPPHGKTAGSGSGGQPPGAASSPGRVARALTMAASVATLGGDPTQVLRECAANDGRPVAGDAAPGMVGPAGATMREAVRPAGRRHARVVAATGPSPDRARRSRSPDDVGAGLHRLAAAWTVSGATGSALADVVGAVERDVRAAAALRRDLSVELAGPRATAVLLAVLPVVGIALGSMLGTDPVHTLTRTSIGQAALVVGTVLDAAGLAWTEWIVRSVQ